MIIKEYKYIKQIDNFLENNDWIKDENHFISLQYDIVEQMKKNKVGFEMVKVILTLMEKHPLVEFGTPGPLTHFIERFYKDYKEQYENQIKKSVEARPTIHTVWILNRLINGADKDKALGLIETLDLTSKNENLHENIREVAKGFIEYHND